MQQVRDGIARHAPEELDDRQQERLARRAAQRRRHRLHESGPIAMAITVDDMPHTDYSPDNVGDKLIWELGQVLIDGLR